MTCVHLRKLYDLCQHDDIRLTSSDLVHLVCLQCGKKEVCPSVLLEEYDWDQAAHEKTADAPAHDHPPVP